MEAGDLGAEDEAMVTEDAEAAAAGDPAAPPVPQHQAAYLSQASMDARLSELEQLITAGAGAGAEGGAGAEAGLERLEDNIVTEFTRQFQPEAESQPVQS